MKINDFKKWKINSECEVEHEYKSLMNLLESLNDKNPTVYFLVIDDIPDELGLEVIFNDSKIAELYCAENRQGFVAGSYQICSFPDWSSTKWLDKSETVEEILECIKIKEAISFLEKE